MFPSLQLLPSVLLTLQSPASLLCFQTAGYVRFGRRDAGGKREQRRPAGEAEEEVPQLVHPQDQQHGAGSVRPAERHAGGTGDDDSLIYIVFKKNH